ncbi:MAG TPA: NEW3 domain-containing protein, partial [archaeon]|nr:NEW3 domain-containing protein [archaeon]
MENGRLLLVLVISIALIFALYIIGVRLTGSFIGFGTPQTNFTWWNNSWTYRFRLEINSTQYNRADWPIDQPVNFTDLLPYGTFDINSTRVIEYNPSTGNVLYEIPSQFDRESVYDATSNAIGTVSFNMNGTTNVNQKRIFYVYYDSIENGAKTKQTYQTNLSYSWNGSVFNLNNSILAIWGNTVSGENVSGLYRVYNLTDPSPDIWVTVPPASERPIEYMEYSNGTHNFSFDFRNNATFISTGPVRIVVEQRGNETLWNSSNMTNVGFATKRYVIYNSLQWIRIETNYTNKDSTWAERNSSFAGAITIDAERTYGSGWKSEFGNATQPGWWFAADTNTIWHTGIIQYNQSGTTSYFIPNSNTSYRIGVQLNKTNITAGSSINEKTVLHFKSEGGDPNLVKDLRNRFESPENITQLLPEVRSVIIKPFTNATVYNRNETALIIGNLSASDPFNLTIYMNATLDMGTASTTDDNTIILYDDGTNGDVSSGDKQFTNRFEINNTVNVSMWTLNFTSYDTGQKFLNFTVYRFNVTDIYNVSINLTNDKPIVNAIMFASINVTNFLRNTFISSATLNCTFDSTEVTNKTDHGNGTYSINFTAPSSEGNYVLSCNATKVGNFGNKSVPFSVEPSTTNVSIVPSPFNPISSNVRIDRNDSFILSVNSSNVGNGTAYQTNVTLEILTGWYANITFEQCSNINKNSFCLKGFNVTVPNGTLPGNYSLNASLNWRNPDDTPSSNKTFMNVTVLSNPVVDVFEPNITSEVGDGVYNMIGNFTVKSVGNVNITNITFSCISGNVCTDFTTIFNPVNITNLGIGESQNVSVNVTVPFEYSPGLYNGTVNVSAANDGNDTLIIFATVHNATNVSITTTITSYTALNVTQTDSESFTFGANATNIRNGSARFVNMSVSVPSGWTSNSTFENCGNLTRGAICTKGFNVTIPAATSPATYFVNVYVNWTNPNGSTAVNMTQIQVTIGLNPKINVSETNVTGNVPDATNKYIGNFTILSIGNEQLTTVTFSCVSGTVCQNFTLNFTPTSVSSIQPNANASVMVNVTVPLYFPAGFYNGTVNVSAVNDGFDTFLSEVNVTENRTWDMTPTFCQQSIQTPTGTACEVNVTNLGNIIINFTVSPQQGNYTTVNETSFYVNRSGWHVFNVTYNTTGVPADVYNSTFVVDANQSNANPDNKSFLVSLVPFIPPIINVSIVPNETEQNSTVKIFANVTDQSNSGINFVRANVTMPNGTTNTINMFLISTSGNFTRWELTYPNGTSGNTSSRGIYNVTVFARDNINNEANINSSFKVFIKLNVLSSTLTNSYYQGDTGSIYYRVTNLTGTPQENITANFTIRNPQGNMTYLSGNFLTNSDGNILPLPTFSLSDDTLVGNYTLTTYTSIFDSLANTSIAKQTNYTFQVLSKTITVSGLFADIETAVVWYPNNVMKLSMLVYNGEGKPVDPTSATLIVYDPAGNVYFSVVLNQLTKVSVGYYTYNFAMPSTTANGMYLAQANVTQDTFNTLKLKA